MKVQFPAIIIPAFKIRAGQLLNVALFGVGLVIPPIDIIFWEEVKLTEAFTLFDTDDIVNAIVGQFTKVAELVWDLFESRLDKMAEDYYERHSED